MGGPRAGRAAVILAPLVIGLVAAGAGAALARTARTRAAVQLLIDQLTDAEEGTRAVPPSPLGSVHFAVPGEERWVDRDGTDVGPVVTGHPVVSLTDPAGSALRFVLSSATDAEGLLARVSPARRLMLSNARLTALTRARLADLRSSQRRAVARADAERLRIERDLHDGAQQRLVGAALHLSVAKTHADPSHQVLLDRAQEQVQQALARLRGITHGPFPPALADDGLAAALDELAEDSPVLVALHSVGDLQVADDVARAVYALIAAALADPPEAPDAAARITVACAEGVLRVDVQLDWAPGTPWDDTDVRDRVGAVGGTYVRARSARSTTITAVIPCGS